MANDTTLRLRAESRSCSMHGRGAQRGADEPA
jgi:hypothetical protein